MLSDKIHGSQPVPFFPAATVSGQMYCGRTEHLESGLGVYPSTFPRRGTMCFPRPIDQSVCRFSRHTTRKIGKAVSHRPHRQLRTLCWEIDRLPRG
jgi:hypothetical protein